MTVARIGPDDRRRFERALDEAGYGFEARPSEPRPWVYALTDPAGKPLGLFAVHVWPMRDSGFGDPDRRRIAARLPEDRDAYREMTEVVLGYDRDLDVYALWPVDHVRRVRPGSSLWVRTTTLARAREQGYAEDPTRASNLFAVAAPRLGMGLELSRPDHDEAYLRLVLRDPEIPRGQVLEHAQITIGSGAIGPEPVAAPVVETGFLRLDPAGGGPAPVDRSTPLERDAHHYFWLSVAGPLGEHSVERLPTALPDVGEQAVLTVQLFAFDGELALTGRTRARFRLDLLGRSRVVEDADVAEGLDDPERRTLAFAIRTPDCDGPARLRCNVYLGSTLLQSRLVTAWVGVAGRPAIRSDLDYAISARLDLDLPRLVPSHRLSILTNGDGDTHQLRFFAEDGAQSFAASASLTSGAISAAVHNARTALRRAAWGTPEPWSAGLKYAYAEPTVGRAATDLKRLAVEGRRLYLPIVGQLTGGVPQRKALERLTARGEIQIATVTGGLYLPAAIFYDHRLDDGVTPDRLRLCPHTEDVLEDGAPADAIPCLEHGCAEADDQHSVCLSGFWGYRLDLGWPTTTGAPQTELPIADRPAMAVAVSTDPELKLRDAHVARIGPMADTSVLRSRDELTDALQDFDDTNVIYMYCHGGVFPPDTPFLQIGEPGSPAITSSYFANEEIWFEAPDRPLIFVNGCHTTALEPEQVINLVDGFVSEGNAVGVIGTEITVFEPLAVRFAEAVLQAFLQEARPIGAAVRTARLRLLEERNPLGLAYVPFVAAATRLAAPALQPSPRP